MKDKLVRLWDRLETLDNRIYFTVLAVGILSGAVSLAADILQQLSVYAISAAAAVLAVMVLLLGASLRWGNRQKLLRIILVCLFNFVLFPLNFFACGGINSGIILFFLLGLYIAAVMIRGRTRYLIFLLSLIAMEVSIRVSQIAPWLVIPIQEDQRFQDAQVTLIVAGGTVLIMTVMILHAFERERQHNAALLEQMHNLSVRDALTGLYNRRELFSRLEQIFAGENSLDRDHCYVGMIDVDNFKGINDTYGHIFGDEALSSVARALGEICVPERGELAARFGGEEFVCVLREDSLDLARNRLEAARTAIAAMTWEAGPEVVITISGGMVWCGSDPHLDKIMQKADGLLYRAKATGKNRICVDSPDS